MRRRLYHLQRIFIDGIMFHAAHYTEWSSLEGENRSLVPCQEASVRILVLPLLLWLWASHSTFMSLCFPNHKMGINKAPQDKESERSLNTVVFNLGFPGGSDGKASACNAGDLGSIPGSGRSPGEGNGNPLQYSCLENLMDRGTWRGLVGSQRVRHDWATKNAMFYQNIKCGNILLQLLLIWLFIAVISKTQFLRNFIFKWEINLCQLYRC